MNIYKYPNTPPPVPNQKRKSKTTTIIIWVGAIMAGFFILGIFTGPKSKYAHDTQLSKLKADSVELQRNFASFQRFENLNDLSEFVSEIRKLGDFYNSARSTEDTVRLYENPEIATLANYNVTRAETVLAQILPLCRERAVDILEGSLNTPSHETDVKMDSTNLYLTSDIYTSSKSIKFDANRICAPLKNIGFTSITFITPPNHFDPNTKVQKVYELDE